MNGGRHLSRVVAAWSACASFSAALRPRSLVVKRSCLGADSAPRRRSSLQSPHTTAFSVAGQFASASGRLSQRTGERLPPADSRPHTAMYLVIRCLLVTGHGALVLVTARSLASHPCPPCVSFVCGVTPAVHAQLCTLHAPCCAWVGWRRYGLRRSKRSVWIRRGLLSDYFMFRQCRGQSYC